MCGRVEMKKIVRKTIASVASLAMLAPMVAGCSTGGKQDLIIYNWGEYIAEDTIAKFEHVSQPEQYV